jgi:lysophospholipase L1-like esterase
MQSMRSDENGDALAGQGSLGDAAPTGAAGRSTIGPVPSLGVARRSKGLVLAAVLAAGCPRESDGTGPVAEGAVEGGAAGGGDPQPPPWTELVHIVGRHEQVAAGRVRYGWPGTGVRVRFHGTALWLTMDDRARYHDVRIDDREPERLDTQPGERRYAVARDLPEGEHTVVIRRRTEGHVGPTELIAVETDGRLLPAPAPALRMEVVGDSITAGYGNEGLSRYCKFTPKTENHLRSYAALAAAEVGAELSAIAWSGKGVARNYGGELVEPLPAIYARSVPTEPASQWVERAPADVVLVNLGTNDFSTDADPTAEEFVAAYVALLEAVRARHPDAPILCTVAPLLGDDERAVVESYIDQAIALREHAGDMELQRIALHEDARGWGCDWHPSAATHAAIAERLVPALEDALR